MWSAQARRSATFTSSGTGSAKSTPLISAARTAPLGAARNAASVLAPGTGPRVGRLSGEACLMTASVLQVQLGVLGELAPLGNLRLDVRAELLGRRAHGRRAVRREPFDHVRLAECLADRGIQLADDGRGHL